MTFVNVDKYWEQKTYDSLKAKGATYFLSTEGEVLRCITPLPIKCGGSPVAVPIRDQRTLESVLAKFEEMVLQAGED